MKTVTKLIALPTLITVSLTGCIGLEHMMGEVFSEMDKNKDGAVTHAEWEADSQNDPELDREARAEGMTVKAYLKREFDAIDLNNDDKITREEFLKAIK